MEIRNVTAEQLGESPWAGPLTIFARKMGLEPEAEATERIELTRSIGA